MLLNISDAKNEQGSFLDYENYSKSDTVMKSLDIVNKQFGSGALTLGAQGMQKNWRMRADRKSGAYTTNLKDLPIVK
jgi:DNA polymerase V